MVLTRKRKPLTPSFTRRKKPLTETELVEKCIQDPVSTMRTLTKNNLYMFLQYFWDEYSEEEFKPNWHIKYICEELQEIAIRVSRGLPKLHDTIINVPPGSTKTAIVSIMFPLWCWTNWFDMKFITASYTQPLALESAEYSRDIIRSDKFRQLFPDLDIKQDKDTKSNFRVVKLSYVEPGRPPRVRRGGNRFSTSIGGTATGYHGHILIVDDPIDPQRAVSEVEINKANHWIDNTLPFRKVDKEVSATIMIMQRLHQNDPTGHLLKTKNKEGRAPKIKHICIPGEIKTERYKKKVSPPELIKYYKKGLLDPKRLSNKVLEDYKDLGQFTYGGQIGQDPVPLGGGMFKTEFLSYVESVPHPLKIAKMIRYWDKAGTEGDGAYTAGVKMYQLTDGKFLIVDVKRGQWSSNKRENIIKATAQADTHATIVGIEQEPGSGGKESADNTITNLAGFITFKEHPTGDKALRADPLSVQVEAGNVILLKGPWNETFVDEMEYFPGSTYKDQIDAASGAFNKLTKSKRVKIGRPSQRQAA